MGSDVEAGFPPFDQPQPTPQQPVPVTPDVEPPPVAPIDDTADISPTPTVGTPVVTDPEAESTEITDVTLTPEPLEQVTPETAPTLDPTESTLETEPAEPTLEPAPVEPEPTPETPPVEPQAVEPASPEQTQPTPEQTPTEGAVEPQPTPEVPAEPVDPETERTNKFGVPKVRKKQKGKHSYSIEYEGDTVDIDIETPHGGTTRDVTIKRPGYAPKQVTIDARSYDKAANQALSELESTWKKLVVETPEPEATTTPETTTEPTPAQTTTPQPDVADSAPDAGRVIQIPTQDGSLEYYHQDADNPGDVTLMQTKKTATLDPKTLGARILSENKEVASQISLYINEPTREGAQALQQSLEKQYGKAAANKWRMIEGWRRAKQGKTEVYSLRAEREGFKSMRGEIFVAPNERMTDVLERRVGTIQWTPNPDYIRPKMSPITKAKRVTNDIIQKSHVAYRKNRPHVMHDGVVINEVPTTTTLVAGQEVKSELLGMAQQLEYGQPITFTGRKVRSIHELMVISQMARDTRVETGYMIFVDAYGNVLATDVFSSGVHSATIAVPAGYLNTIQEKLDNNPDIVKVYQFHNHPSGIDTASMEDFTQLAETLDRVLGEKWGGAGIHDSGTYTLMKNKTHYMFNLELTPEERGWQKDPLRTPVIADERVKPIVGRKLNDVIEHIKNLKAEDGKITFIGLNVPQAGALKKSEQTSELQVHSVWTVGGLENIDKLEHELHKEIENNLRTHGGQAYIAISDNTVSSSIMNELSTLYDIDTYIYGEDIKTENILEDTTGNALWRHTKGRLRGDPLFFEKLENLTERRLVDPRNGYSPQTNDASDFQNQLTRLKDSGASDSVVASVKARLANLHHDDIVLTIGGNNSDIVLSASRIDKKGDTVLTDNVGHVESDASTYDGDTPHVIIASDFETTTDLQNAMDILADDGRLIAHVKDVSKLSGVLSKYDLVASIAEDGGVYIVVDKTKQTSSTPEVDVENVRSKRIPIERRSPEQLAVAEQSGISTGEQSFLEPTGEKRMSRGIGEPGEDVYIAPLEHGSKIDYLINEDPDIELEDVSGGEGSVAGVLPSTDAGAGVTLPDESTNQASGNVGGVAEVSGVGGSPRADLESVSNPSQGGLRQTGQVLDGQSGSGVGAGLQQAGNLDESRSRVIREERRNTAPAFTASASSQATQRIRKTDFGEETETVSGETDRIIIREQTALDDMDNATTDAAKDAAADKLTRHNDNSARMSLREKLGELHPRLINWWKNSTGAYQFLKTGNRALDDMGAKDILYGIFDTKDKSDKMLGNWDLLLEDAHKRIGNMFLEEIKERGGKEGADWINSELDSSDRAHP